MSERKLYQKFREKIMKTDPDCWIYKISDWVGGSKRPFDFFLVIKGIPFALEFKSEKGQLTKYQSFQLLDFINAGGEALVYWSSKQKLDEFIEEIMEKIKERKNANNKSV